MMWRALFAAAGVFMLAGGPKHPGGTLLEMLQHPDWLMSHVLVAIGYALMTAGLVAFSGSAQNTQPMKRWTTIAIAGTVLMTIEMIFHTAAMVDAEHLAAGHATPVLTTHLAMAVTFYPIFGATSALFFIQGVRQRAIGSIFYAWIGIAGTIANGIAPVLVMSGFERARILFPFMVGIAVYLVLAAIFPLPAASAQSRPADLATGQHRS